MQSAEEWVRVLENSCENPMPKVSSLTLPKDCMANVGILRDWFF